MVTGSRDKTCKVWKLDKSEGTLEEKICLKFKSGVSAVCFAGESAGVEGEYLLWLGLENGEVGLYKWKVVDSSLEKIAQPCSIMKHSMKVNRIAVR